MLFLCRQKGRQAPEGQAAATQRTDGGVISKTAKTARAGGAGRSARGWLGGAVAAALLLAGCTSSYDEARVPSLEELVAFAATKLESPPPAAPVIVYRTRTSLRRICSSEWGCQRLDRVYVRDYCRERMFLSICHFVLAHEVAHYILHTTGAFKGDRAPEEPMADAVARAWLDAKGLRAPSAALGD